LRKADKYWKMSEQRFCSSGVRKLYGAPASAVGFCPHKQGSAVDKIARNSCVCRIGLVIDLPRAFVGGIVGFGKERDSCMRITSCHLILQARESRSDDRQSRVAITRLLSSERVAATVQFRWSRAIFLRHSASFGLRLPDYFRLWRKIRCCAQAHYQGWSASA